MQLRDNTFAEVLEYIESRVDHEVQDTGHKRFYLNAYECELGYGGAEEGGWWYDIREPVASVPVTLDTWRKVAQDLYDYYKEAVETSRPHTSAAGGYDIEICLEERYGYYKPENGAPRYE